MIDFRNPTAKEIAWKIINDPERKRKVLKVPICSLQERLPEDPLTKVLKTGNYQGFDIEYTLKTELPDGPYKGLPFVNSGAGIIRAVIQTSPFNKKPKN